MDDDGDSAGGNLAAVVALQAGESARQLLWSDLCTLLVDTERGAA